MQVAYCNGILEIIIGKVIRYEKCKYFTDGKTCNLIILKFIGHIQRKPLEALVRRASDMVLVL